MLTPIDNGKFFMKIREKGSDPLVIKEIFHQNVYNVHKDDIKNTRIVIDIGANIGAFSLYAWSLGATVFAYEPEEDNFKLLKENIRVNNAKNIHPFKVAVGNKRGEVSLSNAQGNSMVKEGSDVPMIPLSDVYKKVPYCDVLKIDVEGYETEILKANEDILKKSKYLTMEFHRMTPEKFGEMIANISPVFNLNIVGRYNEGGGQIYGRRY